jgi:hypothetical protein
VGPFREEKRAQPGAGARSGRGVEVSPVHKRAGHSWGQVPEAGGVQVWAPLEKRRGRSQGRVPGVGGA